MLIMPPWANDHDVAHLQDKTVPTNLIWSESAEQLRSSSIRKIPGALIMSIMPPWANDHAVAHLQTKTVLIKLMWSESAHWFVEFQHSQDSRSPYHAHGHAHYAPMGKWPCRCTPTNQDCSNQIDLEWIGPLVCGVPAFTRFQEPLSCSWACPLSPHGQMTMPLHTYRTRLF